MSATLGVVLSKAWTKSWTVEGHTLSANISPCSWMYDDGLQVQISVDGDRSNGGSIFRSNRTPFAQCTVASAEELLGDLAFTPCTTPGCKGVRLVGTRAADAPPTGWFIQKAAERAPFCEPCYLAQLKAQWRVEDRKLEAKKRRQETRLHAQGFRFAVEAWIHPKRGGDDYQITIYYKDRPADAEIKKYLNRRSNVTDDFTVRPVVPVAAVERAG